MKKILLIAIFFTCFISSIFFYNYLLKNSYKNFSQTIINKQNPDEIKNEQNPLSIEYLRNRNYPSSNITIEETLSPGENYNRYIASYQSDGLKIYGLFTVPNKEKQNGGFPSIVFLHGYLPPGQYVTTERYVLYQDGFAKNNYITFKPDLRGHGKSEGQPVNSNFSPEYVIDSLNLVSALKIYKDANPNKIGMWGHSNGGGITLKSMVVSKDIKAGVIWAGVVGSYEDLLERYQKRIPWINLRQNSESSPSVSPSPILDLINKYGSPSANPIFWSKIDPYSYLKDVSGPIELHHGTADDNVPIELSRHLKSAMETVNKEIKLFEYQGADHNLSEPAFSIAIEKSIDFFDKYLKK